MNTTPAPSYKAPSPGVWELDSAHYPRPVSLLVGAIVNAGMCEGFASGSARYGVALSHFEMAQVNGFLYQKAIAFGAPPDAAGPPPKIVFQLLTRLVPAMRARWRAADDAFKKRLWRDDLRRWDEVVKPAAIRRHRELQAVDPETLDDEALLEHFSACYRHVGAMVKQHHEFTMTCIIPVGDLLAHVAQWTGIPTGETLAALRGSSPVSKGACDELSALGAAIRDDLAARALLGAATPAADTLRALREHADPVGAAARAYLDQVSYRCLGYDVGDVYAIEVPELLVRAIQAAMSGNGAPTSDVAQREGVASLRARVPEAHRARFDELLLEARFVNRLRDERGVYSDGWATGISRRVLLTLGRRLVAKGRLDAATLIVDASFEEIEGLARGERAVTNETLRERATWRATRAASDAPPYLGGTPSAPPPAEWLPENARRMHRAVTAYIGCIFDAAPEAATRTDARRDATVTGLPVHAGSYEGIARVVFTEEDFAKLRQGDVLVARSTSAYFNTVLPLLGAIVTDRGGQLSHAAIIAREFGIPGVVGTREGTARIPDGARVRVDGTNGRVEVLG